MADTTNSKIEASNQDFNTIMSAIHTFLTDTNRNSGAWDTNISSYSFTGDSSYPHSHSAT